MPDGLSYHYGLAYDAMFNCLILKHPVCYTVISILSFGLMLGICVITESNNKLHSGSMLDYTGRNLYPLTMTPTASMIILCHGQIRTAVLIFKIKVRNLG